MPRCIGNEGWQTISKLASCFNDGFGYPSVNAVFSEICMVNRIYRECKPDSILVNPITRGEFFTRNKKPGFAVADYDLVTMSPAKSPLSYSEKFFENNIKRKLFQ